MVKNTTFTLNGAVEGGGIYNGAWDEVKLSHLTLSNNVATRAGGALRNSEDPRSVMSVKSTIVNDSIGAENCAGPIASHGFNIDSGDSCGFTDFPDLDDTDPQLQSLGPNGGPTFTIPLYGTSPAIDWILPSISSSVYLKGICLSEEGDQTE